MKITVKLDKKTGTATLHVEGATDGKCLSVTRPLEAVLGIIRDRSIDPQVAMLLTEDEQQEVKV